MQLTQTIGNLWNRARGRHFLELVKFVEIQVMGRNASTYCYHHPSHVLIELTTRCNLRCQWCNQNDPEWQKVYGHKDFDLAKFEKVVSELEGSKVLLLYNIGEPLLFKRIYEAIRIARRFIPEVRITTNATLLTTRAGRELEDAGLTQLNVSIDSPDAELMERIRTGVCMKTVEENLLNFCNTTSIPVHIWTVISDANLDSLHRLPDWAARFPSVKSIVFQLQNGVETGESIGLPPVQSEQRFRELQKAVNARCDALGISSNISSLPYYLPGFHKREAKGICKAPFTQLVSINVDGHLSPCCSYATMNLGNVVENGFKATWNGEQMRAWRKDMLEQKYCSYCSEWCGFKQHSN